MFTGHNGLELKGDSLKISYREADKWTRLTPGGTLQSQVFDIGDEVSGPNIQLGNIVPSEEEKLDWRHSIDPLHHHGSDQFRTIFRGEWRLAGRAMPAATWSFQDSGMVYQEHPREDEVASLMLIMGDKRGALPTLALKKDEETMIRPGGVYDLPDPNKQYPHPAGNRGVAAIATSAGATRNGFVWGDFDNSPACGLMGDAETGPVIYMLKGEPGEVLLPPSTSATEVVVAIVDGAASIGEETYLSSELRVQAAGRTMPAIVAGESGLKAIVVLADRRMPIAVEGGDRPQWLDLPNELRERLTSDAV